MALKRMAVSFAFGYVLGAKAGDKRYKELRSRWEDLRDHPTFQRTFERLRELAQAGGRRAIDVAQDRLSIGAADGSEGEQEKERNRTRSGRSSRDQDDLGSDEGPNDDEGVEGGDDISAEDEEGDQDEDEDEDEDEDIGVDGGDISAEDEDDEDEDEDHENGDEDEDDDDGAGEPHLAGGQEDQGIAGSMGRLATLILERGRVA